MRSTPMRVALAILLAGVVALAAGCGGGGGTNTTTSLVGSTSVTLTRTNTGGAGAEPAFASAANCQQLAGLAARAAASIQSSGNAANALQSETAEIQALAKAAPSDIRGDFQTFAAAFSGFIDALHASGYKLGSKTPPTPAQAAALVKAEKSFESPKLKQAETHLQAWAKQNCKGVHVGG
jgi:hypothetical protein